MTPEEDLAQITSSMEEYGCKIVQKEGWFWSLLAFIVMVVTFGVNRRFKEGYITTIGPWIGVNKNYANTPALHKAEILSHEFQHSIQCFSSAFAFPIIPALIALLLQGSVNQHTISISTNVLFAAFFVICGLGIWYPKASVVLGVPMMAVFYLLLPLPIGFAYFRWRFERSAYLHGMLVIARHSDKKLPISYVNNAVKQLTTGLYGWTWPFPKNARRFFERALTYNNVTIV